jgi:alkaline phosphatase D
LTGDRHHSELSLLKKEGKPTIYDLTVSPLTSGIHDATAEANDLRVPGSHIAERNFGNVAVKGSKEARQLIINLMNATGAELFHFEIKAE